VNTIRAFLVFLAIVFISSCNRVSLEQCTSVNNEAINLSGQNVMLMWLAPDCPLCQTYSSEFIDLSNSMADQIECYAVLPGNHYSQEEIRHFQDSFGFSLPIIHDVTYKLTKKFNISVTPEFLLIDSTFKVKYQGKFDDWATDLGQKKLKPTKFYLKDAVTSFINKSPIQTSFIPPVGCTIELD
jgi:thioredoxin-related protein